MAKFKVGDVIIGNASADFYLFTKSGWIGTVTKVSEDGGTITALGTGKGANADHPGPFISLDADYFDLYEPEGSTPTATPRPSRKEAYEQLFGCSHPSCPADHCSDCPLHNNCDSATRTAWWDAPFDSMMHIGGTRITRPQLPENVTIHSDGVAGLCEAYNISDSAGLAYLKDTNMCVTEHQQTELEALVLLNELIFVHNSEICSMEDYRERYSGLLSEFGVVFDDKGYASVRPEKE